MRSVTRCRPRDRRQLRKSLAVREKRSTFSLAPDAPPRPGTRTSVEGLLLAGDWIDTGLPATIESAVMSGHRASAYAAGGRYGETAPEPAVRGAGEGGHTRMTSILVHYSEIALKGKNRSWFVGRLVRNIHTALAGLHVKEVRTHDRPHRDRARPGFDASGSQRSPVANLRHRQLLGGHAPAARLRGHGRRDRVAAAAARIGRTVFACCVRRADAKFADAVPRPGARSRLARVARARLEGRSRSRRPGDPRRDPSRRGVLLHGPRAGRRRLADRHRAVAWWRCCPAASTRRSRRGA